ncbi:MAG TPA: alpha/beta hydrolase [Caldithrix abyssi]|uniref:Alpha/beta hydrolase n=1 Tax=Caldithrix abyssi TaxID=187145 RepID=A0A7V5PQ67_CALAY|nr:alpha/beta hydrolase [Caldithrix abyssi]
MRLEVVKQIPGNKTFNHPILFVHGMWHGAWCWQEHFMPYFSEAGFEVWAFSLRGHGQSTGREKLRWTSLNDYVADLQQVVSEMPAAPVLVGHSMGGMIVQKYLEEHHEIPAAVLMASGPPNGLLKVTLRVMAMFPATFVKCNLTLSLYPLVKHPDKVRRLFFADSFPEEKVTEYTNRLQDESYRAYLDLLLLNLPKPQKVQTPLLVLGGEQDQLFSKKEVRYTANVYGSEAVIFPDMGHDMMLDAGWQAVADRIIRWLRHSTD